LLVYYVFPNFKSGPHFGGQGNTELIFKAGYVSFFQIAETTDYRTTFVVSGLTSKGNSLINSIKNYDWDIIKNNLKKELPNIIEQHLSYYFPAHIDGDLWRYMSLNKLESLLSTNSIYFSRADLLGDKYEGSNTLPTIRYRSIFYKGAKENYIKKTIPEMQKACRKCTYISCWHSNSTESAIMWRCYGEKNKSICIKTKIKALVDSIIEENRQFIIAPVHYIDYSEDYIQGYNLFQPFLYKQKAFQGEREFRIITHDISIISDIMQKKVDSSKGLFINANINMLIKSIIISPYADENYKDRVIKLLNSYNLENRLVESTLSNSPNF